ncbi:MAG: GGDEF domain-containing protein, partial [Lachnospiraceae bacterium]|nr:GGDEF domain-containing protein [Lachnospiraceae bacterium]
MTNDKKELNTDRRNRKLITRKTKESCFKRAYAFALSLIAIEPILILLFVGWGYETPIKRIASMLAVFWVVNSILAYIMYTNIVENYRVLFVWLSRGYFVVLLAIITFVQWYAYRGYGSLFFYFAYVLLAAFILYTTNFEYIILAALEAASLVLVTYGSEIVLKREDIFVIICVHLLAAIISRDGYYSKRKIIESASKVKRGENAAERDPLTKLVNRRGLERELETVFEHVIPNRSLVGVILIDIDHFKAYNDTFGHPEGDVCLQKVAASLSSTIKKFGKEGITSRIGGEEFLIFLYGYKKEMFYNIAETVRTDVENLAIKHATGPNDVVT